VIDGKRKVNEMELAYEEFAQPVVIDALCERSSIPVSVKTNKLKENNILG